MAKDLMVGLKDKDMVVVIPLVKLLLTLRFSNGSMLLIQTEADK